MKLGQYISREKIEKGKKFINADAYSIHRN